jgi:hypothetical protein
VQIKFLTIYHYDYEDLDNIYNAINKCIAQEELLYMWQNNIQSNNINFINKAVVEFNDYSLFDFPDIEKAKKEIHNAYGHKEGGNGVVYRWCGEEYSDLESIYKDLAEQKRLMELTITVENEDYE